jgi:hypothetical protein
MFVLPECFALTVSINGVMLQKPVFIVFLLLPIGANGHCVSVKGRCFSQSLLYGRFLSMCRARGIANIRDAMPSDHQP